MKLIIADDIQIIRGGIIAALSESLNDLIYYEADNGETAFELAQKHKADLIITDIKMPVCGGLMLLEKLRAAGSEIPVIILSGFGEFEYAQKALQLGAVGYLLKPIDAFALCEMVEKAQSKISQSRAIGYIKQENTRLQQQNEQVKQLHALQNALLFSAPTGFVQTQQEWFCLAVIHIEKASAEKSGFLETETDLLRYAVNNAVEYLELGQSFYLMEHPTEQQQLMMLFYGAHCESLRDNAYVSVQTIRLELQNTIGVILSVGLSAVLPDVGSELYRQADEALRQKVLYGRSGVYLYTGEEKTLCVNAQDGHLIRQHLVRRDMAALRELLYVKLREYATRGTVTAAVNILMPMILEGMAEHYEGSALGLTKKLSPAAILAQDVTDLSELAARITDVLSSFCTSNNFSIRQDETIAMRVKEYIDSHYSEDISVKQLAERFCVNYSYLSSLFAKEIGVGIVAYGIGVRIEAAKTLLSGTGTDIAGVAQLVGYEDLQYFYRVFKKYTGKTPLAWRNEPKNVQ